jgi:LytR cell envelope-related transcriptional attenuator
MMAALPYALSVHHFISQVGDYVGFAAIVAVAIMVLLLFAHARETAELRRRAEFAEDELSLLHEQVEWLRDAQQTGGVSQGASMPAGGVGAPAAAVPPPASAPPGSAVGARGGRSVAAGAGAAAGAAALATGAGTASATSAGPGGVAPVPAPASAGRGRAVVFGAPVGVGAPALSSATKLIPPTDEELRAVAAASAAAEPVARADPATFAAESGGRAGRGGAVAAPPAPPPSTAAAGGNGKPPRRSGVAADPGAPGGGARPAYPAVVTSPRRNYGGGTERSGGRRINRGLIAAVTVLVAAIAVVAVLVLDGGGSSKKPSGTASSQGSATVKHKTKTGGKASAKGATVKVDPRTVTVAVLNGTTTANLAAAVSDKLSTKGFQQGTTGNAADQSTATTATIVGYVPAAPDAKNDALAVAVALGLKSSAVKPVSTASQSVACSGTPTNCPDQVIVTVGTDLNSDAA